MEVQIGFNSTIDLSKINSEDLSNDDILHLINDFREKFLSIKRDWDFFCIEYDKERKELFGVNPCNSYPGEKITWALKEFEKCTDAWAEDQKRFGSDDR